MRMETPEVYLPIKHEKVKQEPMEETHELETHIKIEEEEIGVEAYYSDDEDNQETNTGNISSRTPTIPDPSAEYTNDSRDDTQPAVCTICNKTYKQIAYLKQHIRCVHTTKETECEICLRTFKNFTALATHKRSVHKDDNKVNCQVCNKEFPNKKKLLNHMYHTHPDEDTCVCDICKKTFKCKRRLKVHIRLVHPDEDKLVPCPHCNKKVKALLKHIQYSHAPEQMEYKCLECNKIFQTTVSLQRHIANVHKAEEVLCNLCQKSFSSMKNFRRHLRTVHKGQHFEPQIFTDGNVECPQCAKKFVSNNSLLWHTFKYHSDKVNYFCTMCQKDLKTQANYKRHLLSIHSVNREACNICQKTFRSNIHLRTHVRVTHAPAESAVACEFCHKTFKCKLHLRMHISAVHSEGGPVNCEVCDKPFSSKKYMLKHLRSHKSEKDCACDICGKMFKSKGDLTKHIGRVHIKHVQSRTEDNFAENAELKGDIKGPEVKIIEIEVPVPLDKDLVKPKIEINIEEEY